MKRRIRGDIIPLSAAATKRELLGKSHPWPAAMRFSDIDPSRINPLDDAPWVGHLPSPTLRWVSLEQYSSDQVTGDDLT